MSSVLTPLKQSATCPNCMEKFAPEDVLWIASHQDLAGDRKLKREDAMMRFLPSRFSPEGFAIDPKNFVCKKLACPNCHLEIPREILESPTKFFSIIGTPGSGKSFLLACMTHELRRVMQEKFNLKFFDPDPSFNNALIQYENNIFHNPEPDKLRTPDDLIRRTQELDNSLFNEVLISGQAVNLAKPFIFQVEPGNGHPLANSSKSEHKLISLYDNSGESFKSGKDTSENQVTIHLREADALLYLFDPTQSIRIRQESERLQAKSMATYKNIDDRQETILSEALSRIWRHKGLSANNKYTKPLIIILTKWDSWCHLVPQVDMSEPIVKLAGNANLFSIPVIQKVSRVMKKFLETYAPGIVQASENFAQDAMFIPVSSFGKKPEQGPENKPLIKPSELKPIWASVPMLYALAKTTKKLIPLQLKL